MQKLKLAFAFDPDRYTQAFGELRARMLDLMIELRNALGLTYV